MYLALYQLGAYGTVWDPLFGYGSAKVLLHSPITKMLEPVPDAFLGALAYAVELISGSIGAADRWFRKPWAVCLYQVTALAMAVVSIGLVISQPLLAHAWCTLCLGSAAISIAIVPLTFKDAQATVVLLWREHRRGRSLWQSLGLTKRPTTRGEPRTDLKTDRLGSGRSL